MPEINDECIFEVDSGRVMFRSRKNQSTMEINCSDFTQDQATSLTWLINNGPVLEFQIKVKP